MSQGRIESIGKGPLEVAGPIDLMDSTGAPCAISEDPVYSVDAVSWRPNRSATGSHRPVAWSARTSATAHAHIWSVYRPGASPDRLPARCVDAGCWAPRVVDCLDNRPAACGVYPKLAAPCAEHHRPAVEAPPPFVVHRWGSRGFAGSVPRRSPSLVSSKRAHDQAAACPCLDLHEPSPGRRDATSPTGTSRRRVSFGVSWPRSPAPW
jgi:hypothetical protein